MDKKWSVISKLFVIIKKTQYFILSLEKKKEIIKLEEKMSLLMSYHITKTKTVNTKLTMTKTKHIVDKVQSNDCINFKVKTNRYFIKIL